ncbi:MAG TPA: MFS transporter, partial [Dehalococcoidia bacterium]|nr:MFS transporter [Dehalococcoidia bacterium]
MSASLPIRAPRFHYGWVIALASLVIGTTAYGVYYSFTLFYPEMVRELGWSRGETSGAITLGLVAYGLFALPMGWLLDRFGPKVTIGAGGFLFGLGTFLCSLVTDLWQVYA